MLLHTTARSGMTVRPDAHPKVNLISDIMVFKKNTRKGLSGHIRFAVLILSPVKSTWTSPSK